MTVYFSPAHRAWRYDFQFRKRRYVGECIDPETQLPARNRTEAKRCQEIAKGAIKRQQDAPIEPDRSNEFNLAQAAALYVAKREGLASAAAGEDYVKEILAYFGPLRPVTDFMDESLVWRYITEHCRKQPRRVYVGGPRAAKKHKNPNRVLSRAAADGSLRTDATTNHYLNALRAMLYEAYRARDPHTKRRYLPEAPAVPRLKVPKRKPRPVPLWALQDIVRNGPAHLAKAIGLTLIFGFRKNEALTVGPADLDHERRAVRIDAEDTKGRREELLPVGSAEEWNYVVRLAEQAEEAGVDTLVWYQPPKGKPRSIGDVRRSWKSELKRLGLDGQHRFHDTKATFVTVIGSQASGPVTQKAARHKDFRTTQRYLDIDDAMLRRAAELRAQMMAGTAPSPARKSHQSDSTAPAVSANSLFGLARPARLELTTSSSGGFGRRSKILKAIK